MYLNATFPHVQSSIVHITFFLVFKHKCPCYPNRNPKYKSKNCIEYAGCYYISQSWPCSTSEEGSTWLWSTDSQTLSSWCSQSSKSIHFMQKRHHNCLKELNFFLPRQFYGRWGRLTHLSSPGCCQSCSQVHPTTTRAWKVIDSNISTMQAAGEGQ